ncbi:recombination regulator RecX [Thermobifida alba]|jgi:regulatory protein|uniref:Regulatory protein RecX n=1 Tax=Thermobifida alba TaxID=53522 RepID=A0ABY4KX91_THEAE|nr:recombination regulator RecX [Thermobifida alba]UPT19645.1 recombination regulator RecX [Thermobifida alba]HLU99208.1 recombination regulator RecX [Thermobifida alba]
MPDGRGRHGTEPTGPPEGGSTPPEDPEARARAICLRLLTRAPRTRAQLAEALRRRDIPEETVEAVLGRFGEVGIVDDAVFAEAWVDSRHAGRGLARRALAAELRQRGVDEDTVREAVDGLSPEREEETARHLVRRRLAATRGKPTEVRVRRLMGMLARKGYSAGLAYRLVREELEAEGTEVDLDVPDDV